MSGEQKSSPPRLRIDKEAAKRFIFHALNEKAPSKDELTLNTAHRREKLVQQGMDFASVTLKQEVSDVSTDCTQGSPHDALLDIQSESNFLESAADQVWFSESNSSVSIKIGALQASIRIFPDVWLEAMAIKRRKSAEDVWKRGLCLKIQRRREFVCDFSSEVFFQECGFWKNPVGFFRYVNLDDFKIGFPRIEHASCFCYPIGVCCIGGRNAYGIELACDVLAFSVVDLSWRVLQVASVQKPEPRYALSCCSTSNTIFLYGGRNNSGSVFGDLWSFNLSKWHASLL